MLHIKSLSKYFSASYEPALKNITLDIPEGEFCVIIGTNGSGKSTLLKTISGECSLDQGHLFLNQKEISHLSLYERSSLISMVSQDLTLGSISEMTLLENMVLSKLKGQRGGFRFYRNKKQEVFSILEDFGLDLKDALDLPLHELSGGQRQAVALCMAFQCRPSVLLLDEHTSALDPKTQKSVMTKTVQKIQQAGLTTLMVTHQLKDALTYGNRLIMMHKGQIIIDLKEKEKKGLTLEKLKMLFYDLDTYTPQGEK